MKTLYGHKICTRASLFYSLVQVQRRLSSALKIEFEKTKIDKKKQRKTALPSPLTPCKTPSFLSNSWISCPLQFSLAMPLIQCVCVCVYWRAEGGGCTSQYKTIILMHNQKIQGEVGGVLDESYKWPRDKGDGGVVDI